MLHAPSAYQIGLDGDRTQRVEQIGTESNCEGDSPYYVGSWRIGPSPFVKLSSSRRRVNRATR